MSKTPPPLPHERRHHPRVPLIAEVQCQSAGEVYVLPVRDASLGGIFLEGNPAECPALVKGAEAILDIVPENETDIRPIRAYGRVVRVDKDGFAMVLVVEQRDFARLTRVAA
jgi:hypothetical protein